ncbi:MlaD family protein, partial [Nocardia farcinica]|uniref:MlaD family protein n=1 Tax=Nocardia farcinica TaxID=37329 RepID=UPI00313AE3D1
TVMAGTYVLLPAMFGIGRYEVTVLLAATGGLYEHANVAYRGTNVGRVQEVRLTPDGVAAKLSIAVNKATVRTPASAPSSPRLSLPARGCRGPGCRAWCRSCASARGARRPRRGRARSSARRRWRRRPPRPWPSSARPGAG